MNTVTKTEYPHCDMSLYDLYITSTCRPSGDSIFLSLLAFIYCDMYQYSEVVIEDTHIQICITGHLHIKTIMSIKDRAVSPMCWGLHYFKMTDN